MDWVAGFVMPLIGMVLGVFAISAGVAIGMSWWLILMMVVVVFLNGALGCLFLKHL